MGRNGKWWRRWSSAKETEGCGVVATICREGFVGRWTRYKGVCEFQKPTSFSL